MKLLQRKNQKGFTLMEVLIVLIILGVLAAVAVPVYQSQTARASSAEAIANLTAARQSALRYFAANGTYATVANDLSNLDFNPNTAVGGQTNADFTYAASAQGAAVLTLTATGAAGTPCATRTVVMTMAASVPTNNC